MKLAVFILILLVSSMAFAQGVRLGDATPIMQVKTVPGVGSNVLVAVPNASISFCNWPANAVPCTNRAQTYTDITLTTQCNNSTQVVLNGSSTCTSQTDGQGNWGVFVSPGSYAYTATFGGASYGPYFIGGITTAGTFTAAGDLSGNSSAQTVIRIQGTPVDATPPATGNFLRFGAQSWESHFLSSPDIPSLDASKTVTGSFATALIPTSYPATDFTFRDITPRTIATSSTGESWAQLEDNVTLSASPVTDPNNGRATFHLGMQGGVPGMSIAGGAFVKLLHSGLVNQANGVPGLNGSGIIGAAQIVTSLTNCDSAHTFKADGSGCASLSGSAPSLDSVSAAAAPATINNADFAIVWNSKLTTNGKIGFLFGENVASTADATSYRVRFDTLAGSLINPFGSCAQGTANCLKFTKDGLLTTIGTAAIDATKLSGITGVANGGTGTNSTLTGIVRGGNPMTAAELSGDVTTSGSNAATIANLAVSTAKIAANAVTSAKLAVVNTYRVCNIIVGAENGGSLVNGDLGPQNNQCFIPAAGTIVEVMVTSDAGTPSALPRKDHLGTPTSLLSGALSTAAAGARACSNTGGTTSLDGTTTCTNTLTTTAIVAGDFLGLTSGTASTAKRMSISIAWTVN